MMVRDQHLSTNTGNFTASLGLSKTTGRVITVEGEETVCGYFACGQIGSGKTSGFMKPWIERLFTSEDGKADRPGAMICNIKDDYADFVNQTAARYGQQDRVVCLRSGGAQSMNILADLPAHKLAQCLVSATQDFAHNDQFWPRSAMHLLADEIALLRLAYGVAAVTMTHVISLHSSLLVFVNKRTYTKKATLPDEVEFVLEVASSRIEEHATPEVRSSLRQDLNHYAEAFRRWVGINDRTFSSITGTLDLTLSAFEPPEIARVLCADKDCATFGGVREILEQGKICVCDFSPQKDGLVGRMAALSLMTQLFSGALATRHGVPDGSLRKVYFIADEAQCIMGSVSGGGADGELLHNFSALARSLRVGLVLATQSIDSLLASTDWRGESAIRTLLRNLRTHVYFRADASSAMENIMSDRGLPPEAVKCVPNISQFHALISRKGNYGEQNDLDQAYLEPIHLRGQSDPPRLPTGVIESSGHFPSPIARWLQDTTEDKGREDGDDSKPAQCLLVSTDATLLRKNMRGIDEVLRSRGYVTVRISAADFVDHKIDPLRKLVEAAGWSPHALAKSAVIIDDLDRMPPDIFASNGIRKVLDRRELNLQVPGVAFEFRKTLVIASVKDKTGRKCAVGFRPHETSGRGRLAPANLAALDLDLWVGAVIHLDETEEDLAEMEVIHESC